ncbi:chorismate synthase, partial [bacterium]|nr:chorismate synthase [bacterium]
MLRYMTAGESHGKGLVGIIDGMPKGVKVEKIDFDTILKRRLAGYGRGGRSKIEGDKVEIISGVRFGLTLGSPIALLIRNIDHENWSHLMETDPPRPSSIETIDLPRPGHADLVGALKFDTGDIRDIIERASARETAMRTAISVPARSLLTALEIDSVSFVLQIGSVKASIQRNSSIETLKNAMTATGDAFLTPDSKAAKKWKGLIDKALAEGDTLGGITETRFVGIPIGIGNFMQWDKRLDARLAYSLMSIPGVRAVEIGEGIELSGKSGSAARDIIKYSNSLGYTRKTNFSGGLEGGMTSGQPLVIRCYMKPIPTLKRGKTIQLRTHSEKAVRYERSDAVA